MEKKLKSIAGFAKINGNIISFSFQDMTKGLLKFRGCTPQEAAIKLLQNHNNKKPL